MTESGHIIKLDFAKAFDMVDWEFLIYVLKVRGFGVMVLVDP